MITLGGGRLYEEKEEREGIKSYVFKAIVVVSCDGDAERIVHVRITEKMVKRMGIEGRFKFVRAARVRAAEILYGRSCRFEPIEVWTKGRVMKRQHVVASMVTMRVYVET